MKVQPRQLLDVAALVAAVAAPLAPAAAAAALLVLLGVAWLATRPPRREMAVAGSALALAAAALAAGGWLGARGGPGDDGWRRQAGRAYAALWAGLDETAERARARLAALPVPPGPVRPQSGAESAGPPAESDQLTWFRALAEMTEPSGGSPEGGPTLLLIDADGQAVAWAGPGLLHEPKPEAVPGRGKAYAASFGAVTLMAVVPLDEARRPWRVMAAESYPADRLPFATAPGAAPPAIRWSLVDDPASAAAGAVVIQVEGAPAAVVEPAAAGAAEKGGPWWTVAWLAIGFALLALAVTRGVGAVLGSGRTAETADRPIGRSDTATLTGCAVLAVAGIVSWGLAGGAPAPTLAALAVGLALAAGGLAVWRLGTEADSREITGSRSADGGRAAWARLLALTVAGGGGFGLLAVATRLVQRWTGAVDLGGELVGGAGVSALRIALAAASFGLVLGGGRWAGRALAPGAGTAAATVGRERWGWAAVALLVVAGALHDHPAPTLAFGVLGGAAAALWAAGPLALRGAARVAAALVVAALAGAVAWETASREILRADLGGPLLDRVAPVGRDELAALEARAAAYFAGRDVARLAPRAPAGLENQDLAFVLWRDSPLARANALSAVVVEPLAGESSIFSFGLPLGEDRRVDWGTPRWQDLRSFALAGGVVQGETVLTNAGQRWATVRYWLVPWSGFRLEAGPKLGEIEVGLLRGGPAASRRVEGLPEPALFALYTPHGQALLTPWEEAPPLPDELTRGGGATVAHTPSGRAWVFSRLREDGLEVLYLPVLGQLRALERIGTLAVGVLLLLAVVAAAALLVALPRAAFRDLLARAVRSYSKRLLIVYTLLLLVPLLLLNAVLVTAVEKRLSREQRSAGEAALTSAQRLVGDLLSGLEPGFGIDTLIDDELLTQLSRVVRHEVNFYWGSAISASSKPELFAAGLLPKRIPGDIYARLALRGFELASRTNRAGHTSYLELYSPLRVPGTPAAPGRLFLSMPLLAQQEEVAQELANLRRQAILVTAALFALLVAVAVRLARNFTTPLAELVEGTRRIAAGAPSLDLAPTELELAALVEAVDEMAGRIAEGREKLVREKQVVERMVENITSGVVSLDRDRRVLMANRVAQELLGVAVGEPIAAAVAQESAGRLAPVAAFLADQVGAGGETVARTVRLRPAGGDDDGEREWSLVWVPVPGAGEPAALLVVEDATETLRGQRLEAWAEMARIIAHEIKNPLTPIRLNVEHMRQVWRDGGGDRFGEVFDRCTGNVLAQVEDLRQIASEFSTYSSIPRLDRQEGDLVEAMRRLVEPYRAAPPPGVAVELEAGTVRIDALFDAKLLSRAVRNLLENALRASREKGGRVTLRVERVARGDGDAAAEARISVTDCGPGVEPGLLGRIFDPYFSTHDTGTGLGLPIARRVAEEHGGTIAAKNRPSGGLEVTITIPL